MEIFAAAAIALYVGHHVGDYWVQTHHQAMHKGDAGTTGRLQCLAHVLNYLTTQMACLAMLVPLGLSVSIGQLAGGLAVSGVTHYLADRREHGLLYWLARRMPWKAGFLALGAPRAAVTLELWEPCPSCEGSGRGGASADSSTGGLCWDCRAGGQLPRHECITDNPQLATGAWALDQSWHIFWGVFVAALVMAA